MKNLFTILLVLHTVIVSINAGEPVIIDTSHYSAVFGEIRNYRLFLPPGYYKNPGVRYPVIYFFHGWSQRYFGPVGDNYSNYDSGNDNGGDNIANYVASHDVIIVKPDGFNPKSDEKYELTPYNEDVVMTHRQFPVYFPELVKHIDASLRTFAERGKRAVCGLSMGGFMSYWVAGKYPDMVTAAGNFCGSSEFTAGPLTIPVDYRILDFYRNYKGVNLRFHYGDKDNLRNFHLDMDRIWRELLDNYTFKVFDAYHSTVGLAEMFDFCLGTFQNPLPRPLKWDHADLYPEFSVWGYHVDSDRFNAGFTLLEKVCTTGFRCCVREFMPDGAFMPFVNLTITTPPLYEKDKPYVIKDIEPLDSVSTTRTIMSDNEGKLMIKINGNLHEIGIARSKDKPNLAIASVCITNMNWAVNKREVSVNIKVLNKGTADALNIKASLSPVREYVRIIKRESGYGTIASGEIESLGREFSFIVDGDSVEIAGFNLSLTDRNGRKWTESFEIPLYDDLPEFKDYEIADGREVSVVKAGVLTDDLVLGNGNGDGIANPGESIVILVRDNGKLWRTLLSTNDQFINPSGINIRIKDYWNQFGGIGSSPKYSIPLISGKCPENQEIRFAAEYWVPENRLHIIKKGTVRIVVKGKDTTPPIIDWIHIKGDNTVLTKVYDGSDIISVNCTLIPVTDVKGLDDVNLINPGRNIIIGLNNDKEGDQASYDNIFSGKISSDITYFYKVRIEATDINGYKSVKTGDNVFLVHAKSE